MESIVERMQEQASPAQKAWFENYVKGTTWIGLKVPQVRAIVKEELPVDLEVAWDLLQHPAADAKLAGMIVLQETKPHSQWTNMDTLDRLDRVILPTHVNDWSTCDWLAMRVMKPLALADADLAKRILSMTRTGGTVWHRRCGLISFVQYDKQKWPTDDLPFLQAAEDMLLASPDERFTQTGVAWFLRYALLVKDDKDEAYAMIVRHGDLWTTEAKKSLVEKLPKSNPWRGRILTLGKNN